MTPDPATGQAAQGENLVFLVSQPRAGSTMLQRMLGAHPEIHTTPEPWMLLPPLYPIRHEVGKHEYDLDLARQGLCGVFASQPHAEDAYLRGVADMAGTFYGELAEAAGKRIFLDKTPRYYFILPELRRAFPKATIILLLRNPLAVLISMVRTWASTRHLYRLFRCGPDLLEAPALLAEAIETIPDLHVMHYETLLADPETALADLCATIGVKYAPSMVRYGCEDQAKEALGDHSETLKVGRADPRNADRWKEHLTNAQLWTLADDYLENLGPETLASLGYDYGELRELLDARRSIWLLRIPAFSLMTAVGGESYHMPHWKRAAILGVRAMAELGPAGFVAKAVEKTWRRCCGGPSDSTRPS
ncbi:MAG: sulfotransferase family protein [Phycisphaerae bacterium]